MTDLFPVDDVLADDALLDRLGARGRGAGASGEPVAALLGALAAHADTPLSARPGRARRSRHRYLGAFAALAIAASGAGVAAAVSMPDGGPSAADRARILARMDDAARSEAPSGLFAQLRLPQTPGTLVAGGLVLVRSTDGTIVLVPPSDAALVAAGLGQAGAPGTAAGPGGAGHAGGGTAGGAASGGPGGQGDTTMTADQRTGGSGRPTGTPSVPGSHGRPTSGPGTPTRPAPTSTQSSLTTTGGSQRTPAPTSTTPTATSTDSSTDTSTSTPTGTATE